MVIIFQQPTETAVAKMVKPYEYMGCRITVEKPTFLTYLITRIFWTYGNPHVWTIWTDEAGLPGTKIKEIELSGDLSRVTFNIMLDPGHYWITCYNPGYPGYEGYGYGMGSAAETCDLIRGAPPNWIRFSGGLYGIVYGEVEIKGSLECHAYVDTSEISADVEVVGVGKYKTPFFIDLDAGTYHLIATYAGQKQEKDITIVAGEATRIDFKFVGYPGYLECHAYYDTREVSAEVEVVGVGKYRTPFTTELAPGIYHLIATYLGVTKEEDATINIGEVTRVDFYFEYVPPPPPPPKPPVWLLAIPVVGIIAYFIYKKYK